MRLKAIKLKSVDSTNNIAIKLIKKGEIYPSIILATKQTKGRGQYGRKWISLKNNLFISIYFEIGFKKSIKKATIENCQIVKSVLENFSKKKIYIKYPNDLLMDKNKKVCGILQETLIYKKKKYIIVGIGINVNKKPKINDYSTSYLSEFTSKRINKLLVYNGIKISYENFLRNKYENNRRYRKY